MDSAYNLIARPEGPITWVRLTNLRDAAAIERGREIIDADVMRLGFDCGWASDVDRDFLGFEVSRHGDGFATWTSGGALWGVWPSFEKAVRETFLTGGCLE